MSAAKVQIKIEKCIYLGEIFPIQTIQNLFFPKGIFFKYTKVNNKKRGCTGILRSDTPSFLYKPENSTSEDHSYLRWNTRRQIAPANAIGTPISAG